MNKQRFSKGVLARYITARLEYIVGKWNFDPNNGTAQLVEYKDKNAAVDYGRKEALLSVMDEFDLWDYVK